MSLGKAEKRYLDIPASWISRPWENALQLSSFGWVRTCLRKTTFFWQQVFANFWYLYTKVDISTSKNMCNPEFSHDIQMLFNYIYYSFPPTILLWPKVFLWYSDAFSMIFLMFFLWTFHLQVPVRPRVFLWYSNAFSMIFLMFFLWTFSPPSTCASQSFPRRSRWRQRTQFQPVENIWRELNTY